MAKCVDHGATNPSQPSSLLTTAISTGSGAADLATERGSSRGTSRANVAGGREPRLDATNRSPPARRRHGEVAGQRNRGGSRSDCGVLVIGEFARTLSAVRQRADARPSVRAELSTSHRACSRLRLSGARTKGLSVAMPIAQQVLRRDEQRLAEDALVVGRVLGGADPAVPAVAADEDVRDRVNPRRVGTAALRAPPPRPHRHPAHGPADLVSRELASAPHARPPSREVLLPHERMFA